jgi:nitrogen-specific signal transduction histidine kinase/ActR/RegA family two-component response regulator
LLELHELAADLERRVELRTAERERALAQLHEAQKLETLGQLTGGVAHDFNNLLTPIVGALDLLQRKLDGTDARTERLLSNALQSAGRAKLLVQRLLGFARRQTLSTGPVDLGDLLDGMRDLISSSVGPTIEVRLRTEPNLPAALADANQLELSLLNLCVNARDAMPDGGYLTIVAEQVIVNPELNLELRPGLYARLSVIDSGFGMDEQTLARAVEPFFSTKETGRGTGLGLSMVHGLAAQLNGVFRLSSAVGKGTRADLYLPLAGEAKQAASPVFTGPKLHHSRRLNLLLVDDEELVRVGTGEMLRDLGHDVTEAEDGQQALDFLGSDDRFDAVVTDYKMPRMDGAQLAERIRQIRPDMPILLITGYTGSTDEATDLPRLAKPFNQADLADALAAVTEEGGNVFRLPMRGR